MAAQDGDRFWRLPEIYIRGNTLKYIRVPEEVCDVLRTMSSQAARLRTRHATFATDCTQNVHAAMCMLQCAFHTPQDWVHRPAMTPFGKSGALETSSSC
jgi:hypothetical protein